MAVERLTARFVRRLPPVVRGIRSMADDALKAALDTQVEGFVSGGIARNQRRSPGNWGEFAAVEEVTLTFVGRVVARNTPSSVYRDSWSLYVPSHPEPAVSVAG